MRSANLTVDAVSVFSSPLCGVSAKVGAQNSNINDKYKYFSIVNSFYFELSGTVEKEQIPLKMVSGCKIQSLAEKQIISYLQGGVFVPRQLFCFTLSSQL